MRRKGLLAILSVLVIVLCLSLTLVACNKQKLDSLYKPTNISYDGTMVTWTRVELADYYTVSINGGEPVRANTNVYTYSTDSGEFEVTVCSVIAGKSFGASRRFVALATINDITVSNDGMLSWGEVAGATAYRIQLNGSVLPEDIKETRYQAKTGSNRIKVRAIVTGDDTYFSSWSSEMIVSVNSAPSSINYDGKMLTWFGNAQKYEVNIDGEVKIVTGNRMEYQSHGRNFNVEIKAVGDHTYSFDSATATEKFTYLKPATNLEVKNGALHWANVEHAEGYEVRINNVVQTITTTAPVYDKLVSGTQLSVEIRPFNRSGKFFSTWSIAKNIYVLPTPVVRWSADLNLDGDANNNIVWDLVNGAAGYEVLLEKDGVESKTPLASTVAAFEYAYKEVGVYKVRVKARAGKETADYCDSKYSDAITIERLPAPTLTSITSTPDNLAAGFTVNYTAVHGAAGYQLYKDGALQEGKFSTALAISDNSVADKTVSLTQNITYTVRSVGTVKITNKGTYVTLSCLSDKALSFNIIVQAMPTDLNMNGYDLSWSSVSGANNYAVKYSGTSATSSKTSYNLSTLRAGDHSVSVCARGNGSTTLASNYTAPLSITRIVAPSNIRITYGKGEGQLEFDRNIANADSFEVYHDETSAVIPEDKWGNMYQYIRPTGTTISMRSIANKWNDLKTIYYMSSEPSPTQQFIRLAAPTYPESPFANSKEFVWNAPNNINTAEYTPTYQVFESGVANEGGLLNGTKYSVADLEGGKSYQFRVKAVGNNTKYLDSELSEAVQIYKLATPKLYIKDGAYHWNGVPNASAYILEIDGVRVSNQHHVSTGDYHFKPNYTTIGTHRVKLYAVGDSGRSCINSDEFLHTQEVKQCLAPEFEYKYSEAYVTTGGAIQVSITKPSANCTKYLYEIAGVSIESANLTESKQMQSAGIYDIRVKALGGSFDAAGVFYLDSQFAGGNTGTKISLLAAPTYATFSINNDGIIKWAYETGALGYDYQIKFNDGEFSPFQHIGASEIAPIKDFRNYKTITIRVRASGNGKDVITSAMVEWTWTNPSYKG